MNKLPRTAATRVSREPSTGLPGRGLFDGGGEMGALMRTVDWSKTRLGPVEHWPRSLRTMLGVVLGSRFPMLLWWGPDLLHLYNDAYRPILRDKHPESLAAPAAEVWAEVWEVAGPMARGVLEGGPATWTEDLQLFIKSGSMAEETYFTFSYSPVPDDDGGIGGLLNTVQETTAKVQGERQIRMLHDLAAKAADAKSEEAACRAAAEVLSGNELDLPFVLIYRLNDAGDQAHLVAVSGWRNYEGPAAAPVMPLLESEGPTPWPFAEALRLRREVVVSDLEARFGALPGGRWGATPDQAIVLPLTRAGQAAPYAFLVAGVSPHRVFDERYRRMFQATADQVANVIANAGAYEAERKRAEALAEVDRAKTAFFSNVSHEFRTPLTLMLGPLEEALGKEAGALQGESLEAVHRNAIRLLRLVNSLLDFARIESGRLQMTFVPTDLAQLTSDVASSFRSLIERSGLTFVVDCPPIQEPVFVDPSHWEKALLNLLSNAFKFTLKGEIHIRLRREWGRVRLSVCDSGIGIPAEELPRIFERFHRVEGAAGRSFEGTGIGLALVQELVKLHGGTMAVASVEGEGSTFTVELPMGSDHLPSDRISARPAASRGLGAELFLLEASQWGRSVGVDEAPLASAPSEPPVAPTPRRQSARVLVADDNADMRAYLTRLLASRWHVEAVADGEAALERIRENPPDLVLSDVMMPKLDGFALLRALRSHPRTNRIPFILLSARAGEEAVLEGLDTGADDYLVKPFSAQELLARVQTHLELARTRRAWSRELEQANRDLEAYSYSVSHDLRAPLRAIAGFSEILFQSCAEKLEAKERGHLDRIRAGAERMAFLIDALLDLSRISRASLTRARVDITKSAGDILLELQERHPERAVEAAIQAGLSAQADPHLMQVLLGNLLGNAWKYTSKRTEPARIEVGMEDRDGEKVFLVRDNGAGFSMDRADRIFAPFQRLHSDAEFEGTGIGLATVHRIVTRHGGRIWTEASPGLGATFFFTLGEGS